MNRVIPALAFLFFASLVSPAILSAQTSLSHVSIVALDPSGRGVAGAQIQLTPAPYPVPKSLETDEKGALSLDLTPGSYRLSATRAGFFDSVAQIEAKASSELQKFEIRLDQAPNAHLAVHGAVPLDSSTNDSSLPDPRQKELLPNGSVPKDSLRVSATPYHDDVSYKVADLESMPRTTITIHNAHTNTDEAYSGVRLAEILGPLGAPLNKDLRGAAFNVCVLATGADGYQAVLTLAEIDRSFHPGEVLIADTLNGQPLAADAGPFRLVVSEDKRPARSVRNLVSIELRAVK
jgi:hypothetical protein